MIPFLKKNKDGKKPPKSTVPRTAQESIPFQRMFEDGTCRVRPGYYTRTIQYQDTTGFTDCSSTPTGQRKLLRHDHQGHGVR